VTSRTSESKPIVFLHVGEPKSGTTFVQEVMWGNRDELARQGVLLPGVHPQDHFRANQDLREAPQSPDDPTGSYEGEWNLLAKQAMQTKRAAVISHELLAAATDEHAARAFETLADAEVHVVLSLRDFESLLPAEWQETVKHRNTLTWEQWIARIMAADVSSQPGQGRWFWRVHDSIDVLRRWSQGVPPERVHIVTMPHPGAPTTLLWTRFASVLGVDPEPFDLTAARPNQSLGLAEAEMLRRLNIALKRTDLGGWFYAVNVKERLAHDFLAGRPANLRPLMSPEQQAWARGRCAKVVDYLKGSGFNVVGSLDDLMPRETSSRSKGVKHIATDDVPMEDVLDAAIGSLATVLHNQFAPPPPAPQEARLVDRGTARVGGSPRLKRMLRQASTQNRMVGRLRIWAWRMSERSRAKRPGR
jgi:hypothetical protein